MPDFCSNNMSSVLSLIFHARKIFLEINPGNIIKFTNV